MIEVKATSKDEKKELLPSSSVIPSHASFSQVHYRLQKWISRFPRHEDQFLSRELLLFYLLAGEKYLDHRSPASLSRLILAIHFMQKKLMQVSTLSETRHLEFKWISSQLIFPFSSKLVLGCLVGFNLVDRYDIFDEENVHLILQKYLPQFCLVKESSYSHVTENKDIKCFYFEIEKRDGTPIGLQEQVLLKKQLEQRLKNSIQRLSPTIFMRRNEEEVYKNILVLSEQIQSIEDLPQASIVLEQQTQEEVVFLVTLVYISPSANFSLNNRFKEGCLASERILTVRYFQDRSIEAHIFRIHLGRQAAFLRSDGSLDFYCARRWVVQSIGDAIGELRDYNGGILLKQQEFLYSLKKAFPAVTAADSELLETFFYAITPLEKQILLPPKSLSTFFSLFLQQMARSSTGDYSLETRRENGVSFFSLQTGNASLKEVLSDYLKTDPFRKYDIGYNIIEYGEKTYFQGVIFLDQEEAEPLFEELRNLLTSWEKQSKNQQILRIGFQYSLLSLDPRIGGEALSQVILGLLFEGLTRFDGDGKVRNGIAENIQISED